MLSYCKPSISYDMILYKLFSDILNIFCYHLAYVFTHVMFNNFHFLFMILFEQQIQKTFRKQVQKLCIVYYREYIIINKNYVYNLR